MFVNCAEHELIDGPAKSGAVQVRTIKDVVENQKAKSADAGSNQHGV
jgi:hypothetical protein